MTLRVEFLPEAESEITDAFRWYEARSPGLGLRFLSAIEAVLGRVTEAPHSYPSVARRTRRAVVRQFPYLLFYIVEDKRVLVTGAFHGHRHPGLWKDRVREHVTEYETSATSLDSPGQVFAGCLSHLMGRVRNEGSTLDQACCERWSLFRSWICAA